MPSSFLNPIPNTLVVLAALAGSTSVLASPTLGALSSDKESVFIKESTPVSIRVKVEGLAPGADTGPMLAQVDDTGKVIKLIGPTNDVGRWGDRLRADGEFAKQFQVYEKKPTVLRYAVLASEEAKTVDLAQTIQVKVLGRPTIFQALGEAWARFRRGKS
ncbi:MAG TPA: hypothetical protein VL588_01565 [Bdellovibrionota bacterium]|jgi:hypothetical protein|nr:hypothetical protein [Bdellovibrionota bacterium]